MKVLEDARMLSIERGCTGRVLLVCLIVFVAIAVAAQEEPAPKVTVYGGYSFYDPGARLNGAQFKGLKKGFDVSPAYFFSRYAGITLQSTASFDDRANIAGVMVGPIFRVPAEHMGIEPFLHALVGLHRVVTPRGSPTATHNGLGLGIGGGLDWNVSRRFSIRLIQADFIDAHHSYDPAISSREWTGARIGGGIVVKFGYGPPPAAPTASCSTQQTEVMAGEPVTVTATPSFPQGRTLTYKWTGSNGTKVSGTAETARVDTTGLAPGSYTVTANITSNKKNETATCSANFTIKEPPKNPPTISCTAAPTTVRAGEPSTVTCNATSPDNRPVNVTYQASGGKISGSGNTATLDTTGAQPGPITVTATAADDRGLTGNTTATVTVEAPPPPPPTCSKANEISFTLDKAHPTRVDNQAKAILDDFGKRLQADPNSRAIIIGHQTADEAGKPRTRNSAAQRAANTKDYLTSGESGLGIDPSRIEIRSGSGEGQTAELYYVPAGAENCNPEGSTVVPEGTVKAQPRTAPAPAPRRRGTRRRTAPTGGATTPPTR
jgi:outer membrane protein OmpA-like peptidoglycan-associated protein